MKQLIVRCDRCKANVPGIETDQATGGFYRRCSAWSKYMAPGELVLCDTCMHTDPLYRQDYGIPPLEMANF